MKNIILTAAVSLLSTVAIAAGSPSKAPAPQTMIITSILFPGYKAPLIRAGFSDSSFDYNEKNDLLPRNKSMCYLGEAGDVCAIIRAVAKQMEKEYRQGAHDRMEVQSCRTAAGDVVEVSYTLSDDYGTDELLVERTIKACQ